MNQAYLVQVMAQDKYIKKHQEFLEKMREDVRADKENILSKIDVDLIMNSSGKELRNVLSKIAIEYYNSKENLLKKSIKSGKNLAESILKGLNGKNKNKKS